MNESEMTTEQASQVLLAAQQARVKSCETEVQAVLEKHKCGILAVVTIAGGQVQSEVRIVPRQ